MYACSYGPLAWCLPAELWSNAKRAKGVGIATATVWWANTVIGVTVPSMVINLGWGTYLFFGCFCFAASIFSYFLVPEVAGKTLEEIGELFGDNSVAEEEEIRRQVMDEVWNKADAVKTV